MPSITNFIFWELIEEDKKIVEKKVISAINPKTVPGKFTFSVEFSLVLENNVQEYEGYLEFFKPNGDRLIKTKPFLINDEMFDRKKPGEEKSGNILTGITFEIAFRDVVFEKPGLYNVSLVCNDNVIHTFGIAVAPVENQI